MNALPNEFKAKGWHHLQLARTQRAALYSRAKLDGSEAHYEVVLIRKHQGHIWPNGVITYPGEVYPNINSWGAFAWTFSTASHLDPLGSAQKKFRALG